MPNYWSTNYDNRTYFQMPGTWYCIWLNLVLSQHRIEVLNTNTHAVLPGDCYRRMVMEGLDWWIGAVVLVSGTFILCGFLKLRLHTWFPLFRGKIKLFYKRLHCGNVIETIELFCSFFVFFTYNHSHVLLARAGMPSFWNRMKLTN